MPFQKGNTYSRKCPKLVQLFSPKHAHIAEKWWSNDGHGYAFRSLGKINGKQKFIYAHVEVMEEILGRKLVKGEKVDHIFGYTLDQREDKLRVVTHRQNIQNMHGKPFRGSWFCKKRNKWVGEVMHNGKKIYVGSFISREEAAAACAAKRKELGFLGS